MIELHSNFTIEGSKGIADGKFAGTEDDPALQFDQDFTSFADAGKKVMELATEAEAEGFRQMTFWDEIEFDEKARQSLRR